jgi:cellobiose transport system substrate-binding protein
MLIRRRHGRLAAVAAVATTLAVTAACGSSGENKPAASGGSSGAAQTVNLVLDTFGGGKNFGFEALVKQYEASHPNIKIEHRNTERFEDQYLPALLQKLDAGSGTGDVVAMEEGGMGLAKARPQYWLDLAQYGLDSRKADFPDWKWQNGIATDGHLFALGTDVGGMAMAYRKDLFKQAGLPTDRDAVSKLWPTWDAFVKVGQQFQAKVKDTKFVDGPNTLYNVVLVQEAAKNGNVSYFDTSNNLVVDSNPAVKSAFDFVVKLHADGLTAKLRSFTPAWNTGFKKSQFATMGAPAWMLGVIQGNAGDSQSGKWDVAAVPGGGGNWGGSWLMVPKQTKHPKEAADLLNFLTSKEGHVGAFKEASTFPSSIPAQQDPAVTDLKNPYFSDAPVGKIYSESVASVQPVFLGEKHATVKTEVEKIVQGVDQDSIKPDGAWQKFLDAAHKAAES